MLALSLQEHNLTIYNSIHFDTKFKILCAKDRVITVTKNEL